MISDMSYKTVHTEVYRGMVIEILASYTSNYGNIINKKGYKGVVFLKRVIMNSVGDVVDETIYGESNFSYDFRILFKPIVKKKFGFTKVKDKEKVQHISEVYEEEFNIFLERSKKWVDNKIEAMKERRSDQEITNGLPDSLKNL